MLWTILVAFISSLAYSKLRRFINLEWPFNGNNCLYVVLTISNLQDLATPQRPLIDLEAEYL